jgi:hypothetical protein
MALEARPKESKSTLEPMPHTFAVENGLVYDYYPIKLGLRLGDYIAIQKLPPVMKEGFVTYQKRLYKVTFRDFFRSRVNVGQPAYTPARNDDGASTSRSTIVDPSPSSDVAATPASVGDQQGSESTFGLQINQAADLAWEDQIRTLLFVDDPQEEWIIETAPQSGQSHESSPVQAVN